MVTLVIEHGLEEWEPWKPVFDDHGSSRQRHGCVSEELFRSEADGRRTTIMNVMRWPDRASAEPFLNDPSLHEAMASVPQAPDGAASGTVVEVYQPGYRLREHVIRPARVVVAA